MAEAVKVIVRCRPLNSREKNLKCDNIVQMDSSIGQCRLQKPGEKNAVPKAFTFDGVFFTDSITESIYADICFPLVEGCVEGYNGTVFAYGQTGCGKSFTMQGIEDPPTQRGIIPRAFEHIFESIGVADNTKFLVHASYLEIYNEDIRDLLSKEHKSKLDVKEHPDYGVYVKDLSKVPCHTVKDMEKVMDKGGQNRSVGSTLMNADSSRSHSIFTIFVETCETGEDGQEHIRAGKLNLVDLAGSERQAKTGATGDRLKEATKINLSLSALGNVISALVDGKAKHIPYRDSKLTRLLQDSLGGNTKTLMVACISPADNNYDETLSTLRYANRAKNIKNKPKINEDPKDALLRQFQDEITLLKQMLMGQIPLVPAMLSKVGISDAQIGAIAASQPPTTSTSTTVETTATVVNETNDEEANKIREEYEEKLQQMQKKFDEEQVNKQLLEEEISKLQEERDKKIEKAIANQHSSPTTNEPVKEIPADYLPLDRSGTIDNIQTTDQNSPRPKLEDESKPNVENLAAKLQTEAMHKLDVLQKQLVGGEKKENVELKKKHKKRKEYANEREMKMMKDIKKWEGEKIMVKVYDNLQEEIKLKAEDISNLEKALESSTVEVDDLQSEFQAERSDYLETIRKMEQQLQLQNQIMHKIQPLIRRDCNYSNIDRMKVLAEYDEENQQWRIPDIQVEKISLPKTGPIVDGMSQGKVPNTDVSMVDYNQRNDVDRYAQRIQNNNNEQYSNAYFKPKRADKILATSPSSSLNLSSSGNNNTVSSLTKLQPLASPIQQQQQPIDTMMARRPQKLQALPASAFEKKKKKNKNKDQFS